MKFRRKAQPSPRRRPTTTDDDRDDGAGRADAGRRPVRRPTSCPTDDVERVDLGSLLIAPSRGRELRLQVDEATGEVQSVMLAGDDGALELRAFAAPRNGDLWAEVRPQIAAEIAQRGGTATEREGRFGTELVCQVPVQRRRRPDRHPAVADHRHQRPALDAARLAPRAGRPSSPTTPATWEDALAQVAVRRGAAARCRSASALPVVMPAAGATSSTEPGAVSPMAREEQAAPHHQPVGQQRRPGRRATCARTYAERRAATVDRRRARPRAGHAARHAAHGDAAPARRRTGPGGRARTTAPASITLVWLGRRRIAGIEPGRPIGSRAGSASHDGAPGHVQPALRADPVTERRRRRPPRPDAPTVDDRRGASSAPSWPRRSAAGAGWSRPPSRPSLFTVALADHQGPPARADRQRRARRSCCWWSRLVQRSTVQFVLNALFGIGIGWLFVPISAAPRRQRGRPGAGLLPARHPLQRRLHAWCSASPA